jgi:hypothetical protein
MRHRWVGPVLAVAGLVAAMACGPKTPPPESAADEVSSGPGGRKTRMPTCRWVPVAPEWKEPCDVQNRGAVLEVTVREDNRPESARKEKATCMCD